MEIAYHEVEEREEGGYGGWGELHKGWQSRGKRSAWKGFLGLSSWVDQFYNQGSFHSKWFLCCCSLLVMLLRLLPFLLELQFFRGFSCISMEISEEEAQIEHKICWFCRLCAFLKRVKTIFIYLFLNFQPSKYNTCHYLVLKHKLAHIL